MTRTIAKRKNGSRRVSDKPDQKQVTEQHHAEYCDINAMMRKYYRTGMLPQCTESPVYGDFTMADDYLTMKTRIADAQADFMKLPAELRQRFKNDPAELLRFLENEDNAHEAVLLGLIPERVDEPPNTSGNVKTPPAASQGPLKANEPEAVKASD